MKTNCSVSFGVRAMRWVLVVSGTLSAVLLSAALALALVHPNNGNAAANLTALSGIRLLTPTEAHLFGRGEVNILLFPIINVSRLE